MIDKLCTTERRTRILEFLMLHKHSTIKQLSEKFGVCVNTVVNDLYTISRIAPIYTKQGNGGGIYILPEFISV